MSQQTTPKTVSITLPEGMTAESYLKAFKTYQDTKERQNLIYKADWRAMSSVVKAHKSEYIEERKKEWKKLDLDVSKMKTA